MRVKCNVCEAKATISSRQKITENLALLYCVCTNPECAQGFVVKLEFDHVLSPSALDLPLDKLEAIKGSSRLEVRAILQR